MAPMLGSCVYDDYLVFLATKKGNSRPRGSWSLGNLPEGSTSCNEAFFDRT